ncbi:MAG TPA: hypothetical protein VHU91_01180 [Mycobacteriales bacterium]|nr:hypothetical protein [Mycobacteriales bacterium]
MTTHSAAEPAWRRRVRQWLHDARDPLVKRAFVGGSLEGLLGGQAALIGLVGLGPTEMAGTLADTAKGLAAGTLAHGLVERDSTAMYLHAAAHGHDELEAVAGSHNHARGDGAHDHGHGHALRDPHASGVPKVAGVASTMGLVAGSAFPLGVAAVTGSVFAGVATGGVGLFALGTLATARFTGRSRWRCGLEHLKLGAVATGFYYAATTAAHAIATGAGLAALGPVGPALIGVYAALQGVRWFRRRQQRRRVAAAAKSKPESKPLLERTDGPSVLAEEPPCVPQEPTQHRCVPQLRGACHGALLDFAHSPEKKRAYTGLIR